MFQQLTTRIIDNAIDDEILRRQGHVDSDVITEQRRSASGVRMTSQEIQQQLVDAHNDRRRSVGATNMELMVQTTDPPTQRCHDHNYNKKAVLSQRCPNSAPYYTPYCISASDVSSQSRTRVNLNSVFRTPPVVSPKFVHVPLDGLWATKSEGVGLIVRAISFQDFQPM